jgi:hypothetical protein
MGLGDFLGGILGSHTDEVKPIIQAQQIAPNGQLLNQQQSYANSLQAQAAGAGPSLATNLLQQHSDTNAANQLGMAAAQRGVNPGLAMKQAMDAGAMGNQQAMQQASNARVGEQLGAQRELGSQLNTMQGQNIGSQQANQNASMQANQLNSGIAVDNTKTNNGVTTGLMNAGGGIGGLIAMLAHGGRVPNPKAGLPQYLADGGFLSIPFQSGAASPWEEAFKSSSKKPGSSSPMSGTSMAGGPMDDAGGAAAGGMDMSSLAMLASKGAVVPGKAKVKGDSYSNDVVPTMLSPGELVIPRSVSTQKGFIEHVKKYVEDMPGDGPQGFAKVLAARKGRA